MGALQCVPGGRETASEDWSQKQIVETINAKAIRDAKCLSSCSQTCTLPRMADLAREATLDERILTDVNEDFDDNLDMEVIDQAKLNWRLYDVIPAGWTISSSPVPECFMLAATDACVIEKLGEQPEARRVVVALPCWAVDGQRARWLSRTSQDLRHICKLYRFVKEDECDYAFCEFQYPAGICLDDVLEGGTNHLSEIAARNLGRDLFHSTVAKCADTLVRFRGLLDTRSVFINPNTGSLMSVAAIGSVLSYNGVKACITSMMCINTAGSVPPEIIKAVKIGDRVRIVHPQTASATDTYSVAAVILKTLSGQLPKAARHSETLQLLPKLANDLLQKALVDDPSWRLSYVDALSHPWLVNSAKNTSDSIGRRQS